LRGARRHNLAANTGVGLETVGDGDSFPLVGPEVGRKRENENTAQSVVVAADDDFGIAVSVQISNFQIKALTNIDIVEDSLDKL